MVEQDHDICVIGGAGHVGLPLALAFAAVGQRVIVYDLNKAVLDVIKNGTMPFVEYEAGPLLQEALHEGRLLLTTDARDANRATHVIVAIGTPVDEYLNPKLRALLDLFKHLRSHLSPSQTIIIRSTVFPRTCRQIERTLNQDGKRWHVAYCPERIAQGYAIKELRELPQIVSGTSTEAIDNATRLFSLLAPEIVHLEIEEAELAKLFSNAWRYIQFAAANQFYMQSSTIGVDFNRVREAMVRGYGRAKVDPVVKTVFRAG
jgi:UDP-N-acetyl-D-mannosaminuronic acid dehydrogenase